MNFKKVICANCSRIMPLSIFACKPCKCTGLHILPGKEGIHHTWVHFGTTNTLLELFETSEILILLVMPQG